ncbi:MAG: Lrp/AsnC family transcriptional regulator [Thaumarchaeota archaeon]|nr:Lrp/AsnC family transcriptional regulator [Nitrososphaerota archaeon]
MDKLDIKIFKSLLSGPDKFSPHADTRKSFLSVARELGVDEGTVRGRLKRLEEDGFLRGWHVMINPGATSKLDVSLRVEVLPPSSKDDVIKKIRLLGGVYLIRSYHGSALAVELSCDDEYSMEKTTGLISRIANADSVVRLVVAPGAGPFRLDSDDLAIIKSMLDSPRKPFDKIAIETGLSPKKVMRKFQRMTDAGVLLVVRSLDYKKLKGMIAGNLRVIYDAPHSKSRVDKEVYAILGERVLVSHLRSPDHVAFSVMLENLSEQGQILNALKEIEGVGKAYLDLIEDTVEVYSTFRQQVELMSTEAKLVSQPTREGRLA